MNTLIAIRLDDSLNLELEKKAAALGISKSKLVREAIVDFLPHAKVSAKQPVKKVTPVKKAEVKAVVKPTKKSAVKPAAKKTTAKKVASVKKQTPAKKKKK
jgi:hypothetical protein